MSSANKMISDYFELVYLNSGSLFYVIHSGNGYKITVDNVFRFYTDNYIYDEVFDPALTDELNYRYARGRVMKGNLLITGSGVNVLRLKGVNLLVNGTGIFSGYQSGASDVGHTNNTFGIYPMSFGQDNDARGIRVSAFGRNNNVRGDGSFVVGSGNVASGIYALSVGFNNQVSGSNVSVFGSDNISINTTGNLVVGARNFVNAYDATVVGSLNTVSGDGSSVYGFKNIVVANAAGGAENITVFGQYNTVSGKDSAVFGYDNILHGETVTVVGRSNDIFGSSTGIVVGDYNYVDTGSVRFVCVGESNDLYSDDSAGIFGNCNLSHSSFSYIFGEANTIDTTAAPYCYILGNNNTGTNTSRDSTLIGRWNKNLGAESFIFGHTNYNSGEKNVQIGHKNRAESNSTECVTVGYLNTVRAFSSYCYVGGVTNDVSGDGSTILGGSLNIIRADNAFIGAGISSLISGYSSSIVAGDSNFIKGDVSFIGGGHKNIISGAFNSIAGGEYNTLRGNYNFIGGGINNIDSTDTNYAVLCGGDSNKFFLTSWYSFIGGGQFHEIHNSVHSLIGCGYQNKIEPLSHQSVIVGGVTHVLSGERSFIGGGESNYISGGWNAINGGVGNIIIGKYDTIGGGATNTIDKKANVLAQHNVICGGSNNLIQNSATSFIGGGLINLIYADAAAILGGELSVVSGHHSVVLGGKENYLSGIYNVAFGFKVRIRQSHSGSAVFGDVRNIEKQSWSANSFTFHYVNGVVISGGNLLVDGKLGVGTPNPTYAMHVNGHVSASNGFLIGGTQVVTGRMTGWAMRSGTFKRSSFNPEETTSVSASPTQAEVQAINDRLLETRRVLNTVISDLHASNTGHGLFGL